ncbi:hypothetical protein [Paenibacillus sp. WLX2291]|uniref:hypothetical protein n=1 Tax=Paenibacillus sp. WLX2291 TaxID=3296934 RepID=UPI00398406C1
MELVMNELSLAGQFNTIASFYDSLDSMLKIQKTLDKLGVTVLSHSELYNRMVTHEHTLYDALSNKSSRGNDKARFFKVMLRELMQHKMFWTDSPKHNEQSIYKCIFTSDVSGYGLAEACERDKIVISFQNEPFRQNCLELNKDNVIIKINNIYDQKNMAELLYDSCMKDAYTYCLNRFDGSNISFDNIEEKYGFSSISSVETNSFISSFKSFSDLSWDEIVKSKGLQYKPYSPSSKDDDWFARSIYKDKNIYKFRVSEKYRCFGYRQDDVFFVLRFEVSHSVSNKG